MKKGLILEGGAMRGMYTAGVLDIFMENDITVDGALAFLPGLPLVAILSQNRLAEQYDTIPNIVVIPDMLGFAL